MFACVGDQPRTVGMDMSALVNPPRLKDKLYHILCYCILFYCVVNLKVNKSHEKTKTNNELIVQLIEVLPKLDELCCRPTTIKYHIYILL